MDPKSLVRDYLMQAQVMQIATAHDHQPWIATVYYAVDMDLNLYWLSRTDTRHSQEIIHNSKVAATIVLPHTYGDKVRGLQIEGNAHQLSGGDAEQGINVYKSRYWIVEDRVKMDNSDTHSCFRLKPSLFVLHDELNFPQNPRQEIRM